jgi:hypothetical protein
MNATAGETFRATDANALPVCRRLSTALSSAVAGEAISEAAISAK